jgi:methylamine---corrinoid protein Co-methyltransferase
MPQTLIMGEGKGCANPVCPQASWMSDLPLVWAGNPGAPHPEELFLPAVLSWAQEPIVDLITCGSLARVDGREVRTADPTEIIATRRELRLHARSPAPGRPARHGHAGRPIQRL